MGTVMGRGLLYVALGSILALAVYTAWYMWTSVETSMPAAGWVALIAGIIVTCTLGFGLMFILFYSSRKGYDEQHRGGL